MLFFFFFHSLSIKSFAEVGWLTTVHFVVPLSGHIHISPIFVLLLKQEKEKLNKKILVPIQLMTLKMSETTIVPNICMHT